jgi:transposase-like protein
LGSEALEPSASGSATAFGVCRVAGFRFLPDVIVVTVRLYLRFNLSYRDVEELLLERGVEV